MSKKTLDTDSVREHYEKYEEEEKEYKTEMAKWESVVNDARKRQAEIQSRWDVTVANYKAIDDEFMRHFEDVPLAKRKKLMNETGKKDEEPENVDESEENGDDESKKHQMVKEFEALKKPLMTLDEIKEHLETTKYDIPRIKKETGLKRGKAGKLAKFDVDGSGKMTQQIMSALFYRLETEGVLKTRHGSGKPEDSPNQAPPPPPPNQPVNQSVVSIHPNNGLVTKDSTEDAQDAENEPELQMTQRTDQMTLKDLATVAPIHQTTSPVLKTPPSPPSPPKMKKSQETMKVMYIESKEQPGRKSTQRTRNRNPAFIDSSVSSDEEEKDTAFRVDNDDDELADD